MRIFDRWKRSVPAPDGQALVPDGHKVVIYRPRFEPYLELSRGGILIANLGSSSDDSMRETLDLLARVEESLEKASHDALLAAGRVSDLFAPADPLVESQSNLVLWLIVDGSGNEWIGQPDRLQQILRRWYELRVRKLPPTIQMVFLPRHSDPATEVLAKLMTALGVSIRLLDPDAAALVEVHRPEGFVISGLGGEPCPPPTGTDRYLLSSNLSKDRANERGDRPGLIKIMQEEQSWLAEKICSLDPDVREKRRTVMRAERLRALLLDAEGQTGWRLLCEELLHRDFPVALMADRDGKILARSWPVGPAIPVFPDQSHFMMAGRDMGVAFDSTGMAQMTPRDLFKWASGIEASLAFNVYKDRETPLYVFLNTEHVKLLSQGVVPKKPE